MIGFIIRHTLFIAMVTLLACLAWTLLYFALLALAVVTNSGLGGPLSYPAWLLVIAIGLPVIGFGVFAPASAIGALFCRLTRLPRIAGIPVVFLGGFVLWFLLGKVQTSSLTTHTSSSVVESLRSFTLWAAIPLGAYWWITEGPRALWQLFLSWYSRKRARRAIHGPENTALPTFDGGQILVSATEITNIVHGQNNDQ